MSITSNAKYGEYLGYPPCCIEAFGDVAIPFFMRDELTKLTTVNGYLPCPACALKILDGEITHEELVNPNRKCSVPFVKEPTAEQDEQISKELDTL